MFNEFWTKSPKQISKEIKIFLDSDFFIKFPELRKLTSVIIVGSIATSNYDEYSDIDLEVLFSDKIKPSKLQAMIQDYKKDLKKRKIQIQIHRPKMYKEIESDLKSWKNDGMLREYSQAIIVSDPKNLFKSIQSKYRKYPKDILKEKLQWLFAEMIFEFEERHAVAAKRNDTYFCEVLKIKIIKYLLIIELLVRGKYPSFDKHIFHDIEKEKNLPLGFLQIVEKIIKSHGLTRNQKNLRKAIEIVESDLIKKKYITKETRDHWIDLRPKHKVEMN
jgi:predicted nucleotidyltransferase